MARAPSLLSVGLATAVGLAPPLLHAQQAAVAGDTGGLEEVVVTARQRAEKLVDVPVSVEAFTSADLKSAGIERPGDFVALTPGLSQVQTAEAGDLQLSIRGINTGRDAETNVALVVDGVLQTNPNGFNQELANIQQIEVLKGPQSAIYGRNAVAGAIIITTKAPTDRFEADATVGYGNKNTQKANAWIGGPVTDAVKASIGAFYRKTNGFFYNSYLHCDDCNDYYKEYGVTPRVLFKVNDDLDLDIKGKWSKISAGAINFNAAFALPGFAAGLAGLNGVLSPKFNAADFFQNVNDHVFDYVNNVVPRNKQENKQVSIKADWRLPIGTLTAWAAYNDQSNYFLTDGTSAAFNLYATTPWCAQDTANQVGAPLPSPAFYGGKILPFSVLPPYSPTRCDGYQYQQRDQRDGSIEVRLTSPTNQPLRWLGGLYYADIKRHVVVSQGADEGKGFVAQAFVPSTGPNPTDLLYDDNFHSKVSAVFGQLAYDVIPDLEAALALRFDSEDRSVDNAVPTGAGAFSQTPGFGGPGGPRYINPAYANDPALATSGIPSRSKRYSELQPKVSLNWKFMTNWSAYASYGYGFRSGGFNSTGSNATIVKYLGALHEVGSDGMTALPTPSLVTQGIDYDQFKKEVSKAAEIGLKAELLDHSLFVDVAAYHTKVDNMQIFNFLAGPFGLLRVVTNVDEATLKGLEGEVKWRPVRYLSLFAGAGLIDSKIDSFSSRPYTAGNKVPYAPQYTLDSGIDLTLPVTRSGIALVARLDETTLGRTWFGPVQRNRVQTEFGVPGDYSKTSRDPYTLLNARLGLSSDTWSVIAWSRNLTNKQYLAEVIPAPEFGGSFINSGTGRAYGVDLSYTFVY